MKESVAEDLLDLAAMAGRLKRVARAGWVRVGVKDPESVADHSYRVALLALALAPRLGLDSGRAVSLALTHDLAEAEIGDLRVDPSDPDAAMQRRAKYAAEVDALGGVVSDPAWGEWLLEYQAGLSAEARLVKAVDRLEMALTALDYETDRCCTDLDEFWRSAASGIEEGPIAELLAAARKRRPTMLIEVAPGIRYWRRFSEEKQLHFNGWILETSGGVYLVDPPDPSPAVLEAIGRTVTAILLTNRSHLRGTAAMAAHFRCPVACHETEAPHVDYRIDWTFTGAETIGQEILVHAVPGKTVGEVALELSRDGGSLVVGDTLIGDPPGEVRLLPREKIEDYGALEDSLQLFERIPYERLCLGDGEPVLAGAREAFDRFRARSI